MSGLPRRLRWLAGLVRRSPLHPQWLLREREFQSAALATAQPGLLIDLGCADRWVERALPAHVGYLGIDSIRSGRDRYGARPTVFGDACCIPIRSAVAQTVVLFEVAEHLEDPEQALLESSRILSPGGRLLLSMPFLYPVHDAPADFQRFTEHGLRLRIESAGFAVESIVPTLSAAETAGLIASLTLAAATLRICRGFGPGWLIAPFLVLSIPAVNLLAWLGGRTLPDWSATTSGYFAIATRR